MEENGGALNKNDGKGTVTNMIAEDDGGFLLLRLWGLGGVCKAARPRAFLTTDTSRTLRVALGVSITFKSDPIAPTVAAVSADAIDAP